jgi:hypothetical protein
MLLYFETLKIPKFELVDLCLKTEKIVVFVAPFNHEIAETFNNFVALFTNKFYCPGKKNISF